MTPKAFASFLCVAAVASILSPQAQGQVARKESFPKIGGYHLAGHYFSDPDHRARIAKLDAAIIGMWNGFRTSDGMGYRDVVRDIRARADAAGNDDLILSKYTILIESPNEPGGADGDIWDKMSNERGPGAAATDWWARTASGETVSSWGGTWNTNITRFAKPDSNGDRVPEWKAKRDYEIFFKGVPEVDSWFLDAWFWRPRTTADWNGDGVNDSFEDPTVQGWYRQGIADWLNQVNKLDPDMLVIGNADYLYWSGGGHKGMLNDPEYKGKIGGVLYEGAMGFNWSVEEYHDWEGMMEVYRTFLANTKAPHIVLLGVVAPANDYQTFRYGLASTLMDDGYLAFNSSAFYQEVVWFDEYDLAGTAGTDWLGRAISEPATTPWRQGVYRRDFENGIALVNPKGNGQQTVTIEDGFRRIDGTQDPAVNNGEPAKQITLKERDGILLVRTDRVSLPQPPSLSLD